MQVVDEQSATQMLGGFAQKARPPPAPWQSAHAVRTREDRRQRQPAHSMVDVSRATSCTLFPVCADLTTDALL